MRDLSRFNANQIEAIKHREGPVAVIASAGSGKTASVVERILTLIDEDVDPSHIFACTFTKKAAEEMKTRLIREIGEKGEYVRVSTLHSFCYQLLKKYYARTQPGYKLNLVNNGQLWIYLGKLIKDEDTIIKDIKWFLMEVARQKLNTISPQEYFAQIPAEKKLPNYPLDHTQDRQLCFHFLYKKYEAFLKTYGYIDYADMLYKVYLIFKDEANEKFISGIQDRIKFMMVDEFQDTNRISFYIYKRLIEKTNNFMVVGDPRQAIYSFQGADSSIIHEFVKEMNARVIELPKNYRSSEVIVEHANKLISNSTELSQLTPTIPHKKGGEQVTVMCTDNDIMEAIHVTNKITELVNDYGYSYNDIAVLYRVHSQSLPLLDQFLVNKVPYRLYSNHSIFERKELKVILAYLKAIAKPNELTKTGYWELANNPLRYIKKSSFEEIEDAYDSGVDDSFWEALLNYEEALDYKQAKCVGNLVYDIRKGQRYFRGNPDATTRSLIEFVLHQLKVKDWFESGDGVNADIETASGDEDRELNLNVLFTMAEKYKNVEDFLLFVDGLSKGDKKTDEDDKKRDAVHMLSLHRSKGLEFPVVFIIGMCSRTMPFYKAVEEGNVDEERRLAYVGVTRAEKKLFVSNIKGRLGRFHVEPSFFIQELGLTNEQKVPTNRR